MLSYHYFLFLLEINISYLSIYLSISLSLYIYNYITRKSDQFIFKAIDESYVMQIIFNLSIEIFPDYLIAKLYSVSREVTHLLTIILGT